MPVPAPFTSQTCSACHKHSLDDPATAHLPQGRDGDRFVCPLCGFACGTDENAARNIARLALALWQARLEEIAWERHKQVPAPAKRRRSPFGRKEITHLAGGRPVPARGGLAAGQPVKRESLASA